ncbi:hypothetical protein [Amycolatopsis methanolica]|uniref:hypothetical protein n=1 Tax=Amycolatopsis methanolica TaxID=1814 RepID=UPI00343BEEF8
MASYGDELHFIVDSESLDDPADAREIDFDLEASDEDEEETGSDTDYLSDISTEVDPVAAALTPGKPLFLIQRSHQQSAILPQVFNDVAGRHLADLSLGAVAPLPRMSPDGARKFFAAVPNVPVRIADPECFARLDSFGTTLSQQRDGKAYVGQSGRYWDYFTDDQPVGQSEDWVKQVLDAQRVVGATLLLTPGMWADAATAEESLISMRRHADWARSNLSDAEHLAVNSTMSATWLTTARLREQLLNELIDSDEQVFYIRFRWPLLAQPYGHLLDTSILEGYAELASTFQDNGKILILPNTGLTGWLSVALGAHGFSTGLGSGERAFADTRVIKIKQKSPRPAPTQRIFAPSILHIIERSISDRLDALPEARACDCRFCRSLRQQPTGQFDKALAGAHYLRRVADLTARISGETNNSITAARNLIQEANEFRREASSTVPLTGANDPKHLPLWAEIIS